uniref:Lipoprotein n=1 Tax=Caulobacter sp. (strain K31) TaxID=366602 RepID=B0SW45_CAUSK
MFPRRLPLALALLAVTVTSQGCLAVAAGGAVVGATGAVVGTTGKVVVATGKAVIPGESKKDREKREFKAWKKSQRD